MAERNALDKPRLSALVVAHNEEAQLADCLATLQFADELVVVLFLASTEQHTVPRRMWSGIRELISPTITAAATLLIILSIMLMTVMELLRRRGERLRGITPS